MNTQQQPASPVAARRKRSLAVLLVLLGSLSLLAWSGIHYRRLVTQVVPVSDWSAAAAYVKGAWQEGDFVAVVPFWDFLGDAAFKGMRRMLVQHPELEGFPNVSRLWVAEGYGRFDVAKLLATDRYRQVGEPRRFGNATVWQFEVLATRRVKLDFLDLLDKAEVFELRGPDRSPCPLRGHRHACSGEDWNYVGPTKKLIDLAIREMIWAHPSRDGILIRFKDVELGDRLLVGAALCYYATGYKDGTPVELSVYVDGGLFTRLVVPNEPGMKRWTLDLGRFARGRHQVEFKTYSVNPGRRHFVFEAMTE